MTDVRAKFEAIWPVPEGVYWMPLSRNGGEYMADPTIKGDNNRIEAQIAAEKWDARLETFTRCQEMMESVEAERDQLKAESEESAAVIDQLAKILAGVAVALKGEELPMHRHGYHDLVECVTVLKLENDLRKSENEQLRKDAERHRWLRQHEFDIGSYHGVHEHNHAAWFEHIDDEAIDRSIAEEAKFADDNEQPDQELQ